MSHIFISYSRKDIDFAQKIVDALAANDLDTWIDWRSIPKGEDWEQEIYYGIEGADAFLFLISSDSVVSKMCNKEIEHAFKNGKRILPIVISDVDPEIVHPEISKRNWIFCRHMQDDFNKAIEATRKTIHIDYPWLKYHTELQVKALNWEQNKDNSRLLRGKELREAEEKLANTGNLKDPQPTELHRYYVLTSQRNEERQGRQVTIGLTIGLIVMSILFMAVLVSSVVALLQRNEAQHQAKIALAHQLAAQAKTIFSSENSKQQIGVLLAIQSMEISPSVDAALVLQSNDLALPLVRTVQNGVVTSVAFSPDGKYVVSGSWDGTARVVVVATGKEIAHLTHDNKVTSVALSLDGKYVLSASEDKIVRVWEVATSSEIARMTY